jgi:hypothetical protein
VLGAGAVFPLQPGGYRCDGRTHRSDGPDPVAGRAQRRRCRTIGMGMAAGSGLSCRVLKIWVRWIGLAAWHLAVKQLEPGFVGLWLWTGKTCTVPFRIPFFLDRLR